MSDEFVNSNKRQLFDILLVREITAAAIIMYLTQEDYEDVENIDENSIAEFVMKNFPQIVTSITDNENPENG